MLHAAASRQWSKSSPVRPDAVRWSVNLLYKPPVKGAGHAAERRRLPWSPPRYGLQQSRSSDAGAIDGRCVVKGKTVEGEAQACEFTRKVSPLAAAPKWPVRALGGQPGNADEASLRNIPTKLAGRTSRLRYVKGSP